MTGRTVTIALIGIACALYVQACTSGPNATQPSQGSVKLKVLVLPHLTSAPLYVAADGGHFAAEGLDVEFVSMTRSTDALVALSRGDLDVWVGAVSLGLINALARDAGIHVVSDRTYFARAGCTYAALMVRRALAEGGEIRRLADLRGRRVALNPASTQGYVTAKMLVQAALTLDDITIADLPEGAVVADALRNGSVDAAIALEPWVTRNLQAGIAVVFATAEQVAPDFQHMVAAFGPSLLAGNPDAGRRFMKAYLAAVKQYNEGKTTRNVEILARHTGLDEETVRMACWPSVRGNGRVDTASMLDFQVWGLKRGFLDRELAATRFWDPAFVDFANQTRQ